MVLALAIAGLVFASSIIPTTRAMASYQQAELNLQTVTLQWMAGVRAMQVAGTVWRDKSPPAGYATLDQARADRLRVGDWELRAHKQSFEQRWQNDDRVSLAEPIESFTFQYLLDDGTWVSNPDAQQTDAVLAIRASWTDVDAGQKRGGLAVMPDRQFAGGLLELAPPDTSKPYKRKDYERQVKLPLGSWP